MQLTRRQQFNLIITTGKSAPHAPIRLLLLLLLAVIVPYHVTIALPEGTFPVAKRMNIETCLVRFDVHLNTIIRTEESRSMGARFLDDADLNSREQCLRLCCETENCDVFVFEEKSPGTCFLFQCGPPENFRCKFTRHSNYTSAVLSIPPPPIEQPPPPPPLAAQIQSLAAPPAGTGNGATKSLSQHEMELVSLKDGGGTSKLLGAANFASPPSSTTSLPPLGVRLGEMLTTPSPSTPKQQSLASQQCGHFEFPCHSGECIAVYNVCDGIPQCEDGSDEGAECPQKNSGPVAMQGARDQSSGHGRTAGSISGGGSVNQPIIMIPGVRGGVASAGGGNMNPMGMNSPGMLPLDQRMYQPMDYQQPPNRFSLTSLEQQQQQQQQMHRNREDPMTAPKPWPRPAINEPNYVDTADSHIFNHKGGLQLSAVNNMVPPGQQYQESLSESSYMPASSVVRAGGGKSYLTLAGSNSYPQQALQQFPVEQSPQQQPPYKTMIPSQWIGKQYIQPPVQQQQHPSIATQDIQSTSNGAGDGSVSSSIALQQQSAQNQPHPASSGGVQWAQAASAAGTPTPGTLPTGDGSANRADSAVKDPSTSSSHESMMPSAAGAPQNGAKHKPPSSNAPSGSGAEYEEDAYDDTYPESTNAAGASGVDDQSQPPTQTEPPKKKLRKHRKHDHDHGKQDGSENGVEPLEQKKKKKTKTIKKDKAAEHEAAGHHAEPIVHEHLKALHKELEIEFADHDGYADRPGGAMLSLTLGVLLTAAMGILLSCRMRVARRRIRRPGKSSYAHDADFLVNGMYAEPFGQIPTT
uniref:Uncharacterized protein n=1 Tax=Anopheles stephensi TaxID=30069 RepID=A0A182YGY1_ANOST